MVKWRQEYRDQARQVEEEKLPWKQDTNCEMCAPREGRDMKCD